MTPPPGHTIFQRKCPARPLLERVTRKWSFLVVCALKDGPLRFGELRRQLEGVSEKMLAESLDTLERDGLVRRTPAGDAAVRVEYALSELGGTLVGPLLALCRWSEDHLPAVEAARGG